MSNYQRLLLSNLRRLRHFYAVSPPPHALTSPIHRFSPLVGGLERSYRNIWTRSGDDSEFERYNPPTELTAESGIVDKVASLSEASVGEESFLPVRAIISLLDNFHDLTGLPWWMIIVSSTVALRLALLPITILQLQKLKTIAEFLPKLPPPFPPPLSGRSYVDQFLLFRREKLAVGCPSLLWFLVPFIVQMPCFLLWVTSIRRMSLDHHPGFDCGGLWWFQDLTQFPHGMSAPIFPLLIASLHYINVEISFRRYPVRQANDMFDLLVKYYRYYLKILTLPILFFGFQLPQGSLVYWVTNSSLTAIQQLSFQHPIVREKLGLPDMKTPEKSQNSEVMSSEMPSLDSHEKQRMISGASLSPQELLAYSVQLLYKKQGERAIPLLKLALEKDPEFVGAMILMGQTHLQQGLLSEAIRYLESAVSKLLVAGHPAEAEDVDHLILASVWAGAAYIRQGKRLEGLAYLERIASMKEPEDSKAKAHYFDGLLMLSSALYSEGRKDEALRHLRRLVAYDPAYSEYLEQCEKDEDEFGSDLVNSTRGKY